MKDIEEKTRRSPVVDKILRHPAAPDAESEQAKKFDDARSRDNLNLELRYSDGKRKFFSLVELGETDFDPGEPDTITLYFARANVMVTGRGLVTLYEKLLDQRARFIQQGTDAESELESPTEAFIDRIEIERKEY
jgi:hypothetical protein